MQSQKRPLQEAKGEKKKKKKKDRIRSLDQREKIHERSTNLPESWASKL